MSACTCKRAIVLMLSFAVVFGAFAVMADDSDAAPGIDQGGIKASGFKQDRDGTLTVPVGNLVAGTATLTITENGDIVKTQTYEVNEETTQLQISFRLSVGTHTVDIALENEGTSAAPAQFTFDVAKNVWSSLYTYVAIVIVAIIVVIIAVLYMRANPRVKPTTTFTELEQEKAAKSSEQTAPAKTEKKTYKSDDDSGKIKYTSSRRK